MPGSGTLSNRFPTDIRRGWKKPARRFSGGERQRIALARILLQDTSVVLLDEPTVGLDPRTEKDLLNTLFSALQDKTLMWVTHHLLADLHLMPI